MAVLRLALCQGCRTNKPVQTMIHGSGHRYFCSKGCAAKAEWLFTPIPTPRKAP
jgi:hypothetical protein